MIVADSGDGIAPADVDRIFERFRSGDQLGGGRGTGLGLALVRAVARAHGGDVEVRSTPGRGSEFELRLPVLPPGEAAGGAAAGGMAAGTFAEAAAGHGEEGEMVEDPWAGRTR
jgi:hypothetical protein